MKINRLIPAILLLTTLSYPVFAQQLIDKRTQYPRAFENSYVGVHIGSINYRFSHAQLEPGYSVESVKVPHTAVRIILFGHAFNKYVSAQVSYMRPVNWVAYNNINGDQTSHSVWMNVGGLTVAGRLPIHRKFSLTAEAGLGIITRKGFSINDVPVVKDANYGTLLSGAALQYHLNKKWDLQFTTVWSPANKKVKQPATLFFSAGFNYYMRKLSAEKVTRNSSSGYLFPKQLWMAGYTTNGLGYGVNDFASKGTIPFFWGGEAHIRRGFSLSYQRNIFRSKKVFAFDWAAGIGIWQSRDKRNDFFTLSLNPVFRFTAIRTRPVDLFFEYSVAGPTYISKTIIDDQETGRKFTFHDFMGMGFFTGKNRNIYAGLRIAHYSNGNLFPRNDGVKIPLTFGLGWTGR